MNNIEICKIKMENIIKRNSERRSLFGEVFTPWKLIEETLEKLDKHHFEKTGMSIFSEINYRWFDHSSGCGQFSIVLFFKLMKQIKIPDVNKRTKHILEKMIFMSEFGENNVKETIDLFTFKNTLDCKLNIHCGDTLSLNTFDEWRIDKFDVVMGNPPYNSGSIGKCKIGDNHVLHKSVWAKFIKYSIDKVVENGYLFSITPNSWLKITHELHNTIIENHLFYLKLMSNSVSKKMINATIPISIFLICKNSFLVENSTEILTFSNNNFFQYNHIFNNKYSYPLNYFSIFRKIIYTIDDNTVFLNLKCGKKTNLIKGGELMPLPIEYNFDSLLSIDRFRIKDGYQVRKINKHDNEKGVEKLIYGNYCSFVGGLIDDGRLSICNSHSFAIYGDKLQIVKEFLESNLVRLLVDSTKYSQDYINPIVFEFLIDPRFICSKSYKKQYVYQYFGFDQMEINEIENYKSKF
jgi:hypothetical protein